MAIKNQTRSYVARAGERVYHHFCRREGEMPRRNKHHRRPEGSQQREYRTFQCQGARLMAARY